MAIELNPQARKDAIASLRQYAGQNFSEPLGELPAGQLLDYILEDIGPAIYNKAVLDAQERMQMRAADLTGELYVDEFQYWSRLEKKRRNRR